MDDAATLRSIIGEASLRLIQYSYLHYVGTKAAIYEVTGDEALPSFSSRYCDFLTQASKRATGGGGDAPLPGATWICRRDCWGPGAESIEEKKPCERTCSGGITIHAVPVISDGVPIGALTAGVSDPPTDTSSIRRIAATFEVDPDTLASIASQGDTHANIIGDIVRRHLSLSAATVALVYAGHKTARDLRTSEEKFRAIFKSSYDGIVVFDRSTRRIIDANPAMAGMFGYADAGMKGLGLEKLHPTDRAGYVREDFETHARREKSYSHGIPCLRRDGSIFYADISSFKTVVDGKECITAFFRDVTEKKHTEDALREKEKRYDFVVESMGDGVAVIDDLSRFTYVNDAFCRMLGYAREDLAGRPIFEFADDENRKIFQEQMTLRRKGGKDSYEVCWRGENGQSVCTIATPTPIYGESGEFKGSYGVFTDITRLRRTQEELEAALAELRRSNGDLEQFARVISHDLQEPLRMVAGFTRLLAQRHLGKLEPEANEFIKFAVEGSERMQEMIGGLLMYSLLGREKGVFAPTECESVLDQARANLRTVISETGARITNDPLPIVIGDPIRLVQLFQNLISNALKFRNSVAPEVHVGARREGGEWVFAVRDNGIGFDPKFAHRIFEIYRRLHDAGKYPGTGVGLSICKKIVEQHGGRIWADSTPEKGSTFYFTLPEKNPAPSR